LVRIEATNRQKWSIDANEVNEAKQIHDYKLQQVYNLYNEVKELLETLDES
jgi:hypothetical protein